MEPQDWGESSGSPALATLREVHSHKRDERRFQLCVLVIFSVVSLMLVAIQAFGAAGIVAKDLILLVLPIFTFVLGKIEGKHD